MDYLNFATLWTLQGSDKMLVDVQVTTHKMSEYIFYGHTVKCLPEVVHHYYD